MPASGSPRSPSVKGTDWLDTAMDLILAEHQRVDTIYFMMERGERQDPAQAALDQDRHRRRRPRSRQTDRAGPPPLLRHLPAYPGQVRPRGKGTPARGGGAKNEFGGGHTALDPRPRPAPRRVLRGRCGLRPEDVGDRATFEAPHQLSEGIRHVLVNGVVVVNDGKHTGAKPGRIVRGPGYAGARD